MPEDQVSEETQSTETDESVEPSQPTRRPGNTNDSILASLDEINDVETLKSMVKTLRSENGNHRRKNKDMESENQALKSWKHDHLRGVADAEEKVAKANNLAKQYVIKAVALEFDIDDDLVDLITGDSEEEIWAKGEKLANTKKKGADSARNPLEPGWVPGPTQLLPGKRGEPVRRGPKNDGSNEDGNWLKEAWFR